MKTQKNGSYVFLSLMVAVFLISACHREALENIQKDLDHVQTTLDDVNTSLDADHKALHESLAALNKKVDELNEKVEQLQKKAREEQKTRPGTGGITSSDVVKEAEAAPDKVRLNNLPPCGTDLTIYTTVTANNYIDYYANWEKQVSVSAKTKFPKAFHLNQKLIKAINCQVSNPVSNQKGIHVAMGLSEKLTGNDLDPSKVVMLVFPLDDKGKKLATMNVYGVSVNKGYHLPCPEWCD